jgi:hypothetical protein
VKFNKLTSILLFSILCLGLSSCDFFWGKKTDDQNAQIFKDGRIDPNLIPNKLGYVPISPIWTGYQNPVDVIIGYDEMVYVIDDRGLVVSDQTGAVKKIIPILGATDVAQDRRLHIYVAGRVNKMVNGKMYNLPAVYHLVNVALASGPVFVDTLIHPFCDKSRNTIAIRPADEKVSFTGIYARFDNSFYVSRTGNVNDITSTAYPDNTILIFDANGKNLTNTNTLNPTQPSLKSCVGVSAIAGFTAPPQKVTGVSTSNDFIITQADQKRTMEFRTLWIQEVNDPDLGTIYTENTTLLDFDVTKADSFLMDSYKFKNPQDVFISPDANGYIFVVDAALHKLYQFTPKGYEGVNPPVGSKYTKQVISSFGGLGSGPFNFNEPSGVCYYGKTVYVADKKNNRIIRFKLSTDIE